MQSAVMVVRRLKAQAAGMRQQADEIDLLADQIDSQPVSDPFLKLRQISEDYDCGRHAIKSAIARGELRASRGPHNNEYLIRRSEIERWLEATPHTGSPRPVALIDDDDDEADRELAELARLARAGVR